VPAKDLRDWIALLEREGELVRVAAEVDPQVDGAPGRLADGWVGLAVRQLQARRIDRPG